MEPHITWDVVLEQVLAGDELFAVNADSAGDAQLARVEDTGVWRGGHNTRLSGAIGITIDLRGAVVEMVGHAAHLASLPDSVRELIGIRVAMGDEMQSLPRILGGIP